MSLAAKTQNCEWTRYLNELEPNLHPALAKITQYNQENRLGQMGIAAEQVRCLVWLARLIGARRYLEVGVFTGYSSTAMALALPEDGEITACDVSVTFTQQAKMAWQMAGVSQKITLYLQPALITFNDLLTQGRAGFYDMALIDADKQPTPEYVEGCLKLLRRGGVMAIDNVFSGGRVWHSELENVSSSLATLRQFNREIVQDGRVHCLNIPLGDGLTLLMKK